MAEQNRTEIRSAESGAWNEDAALFCLICTLVGVFIGAIFVFSLFPEQTVCKESLMSFKNANKLCYANGFDRGGFLTMSAYSEKYQFAVLCSKSDGSIKSFRVE